MFGDDPTTAFVCAVLGDVKTAKPIKNPTANSDDDFRMFLPRANAPQAGNFSACHKLTEAKIERGGLGFVCAMSALGQKRTWDRRSLMSALPPKADIDGRHLDVCFVPIADIADHQSYDD